MWRVPGIFALLPRTRSMRTQQKDRAMTRLFTLVYTRNSHRKQRIHWHKREMSVPVDPELQQHDNDNADLYDDIDVTAMMGGHYDESRAGDDDHHLAFSEFEDEVTNYDAADDEILAAFSDDDQDFYEDDDEEDFMDAIREANNFSTKKRNKKKTFSNIRPDKELDPEVRILLSKGNDCFVSKDFTGAEKIYLEVVKRDPKNFPAYKSLGEIYQIQNTKSSKNKSCNAWFLAAHIKPQDGEFWALVAKQSRELGHVAQALYCYGRAISAGYKSFDVMLDRAVLYRETGQLGRASESLQRLHEAFPSKSIVLRELALIYIQLNRVNDAIAMYLKVFDKNIIFREQQEYDGDDELDYPHPDFPVFEWSSLNILTELFMNQKNYSIAIKTIKHAARWIQRREDETLWEESTDDSEFDERRYENSNYEALPDLLKQRSHKLPIDIRVKLGSLRLNLNDVDEALIHYTFLLNDDVTETADLFHEAATKLEEAQLFGDAVKFYIPLSKLEEFHTPQLYSSLARCCTELGRYQEAKEYYNVALSMDSDNLDTMLSLVEILYYLEEVEESQQLLDRVNMLRARVSFSTNEESTTGQPTSETLGSGQALIENSVIRAPKKGSRLSEPEKQARESRIKQNVIDKYNRLQRLHKGLEAGDTVAASTWLQLASDLIEIFSNVKNFFPKDRSRQFKGIIMRTKGLQMDIDSKIERISQLYEGFTSKVEEKVVLTSKEEFRGVTYQQWFDLFMEYALAVARFDNPYDASSIIDNAKNVNVFFQDKERERVMSLVELSVAIRTRDQKDILSSMRSVLNTSQFNKKLLKLFLLAQPSGKLCTENFISINHQKYFLRQIKAFDSLKLHKSIPGMATIANKDLDPKGQDNVYLMYIYACLLFTNRSYVPSLVYFTRIYKNHSKEPMVCFLSGLAHIHRAMQRSSTNRHMELLQGFKYLMEYYELRSPVERQEALYNMGRAFHLLGLVSIAVEYYNKVLTEFDHLDDEEDLKRQTAYNLVHIYNNSGNTKLSRKIIEKYLTV